MPKSNDTETTGLSLETKLDGLSFKYNFNLSRNEAEKKAKLGIKIQGTFDFTGVSVAEVIQKAIRQYAIAWQSRARPVFDQYETGQKVQIAVADIGSQLDSAAAQRNKYMAAETLGQKAQVLHESTDIPLDACRDIVEARMAG